MSLPSKKLIHYDRPATYQISVQGQIDLSWSDCLEGMTIYQSPVDGDPPITTLQGELSDQAALTGVLNTLYEQRLPILSVILLCIG